MGFAESVQAALDAAWTATASPGGLQADVVIRPWVGQDGRVQPQYGEPFTRSAFAHLSPHQHQRADGRTVEVRATLSFRGTDLEPNGAAFRTEPIDPRDELTVKCAGVEFKGPIVDVVPGLLDPTTGRPFVVVVYLGG